MTLAALLFLQDPDELVRRLGDDDPAARQAAAAALVEMGEDARPALTRAAESPDTETAQLARMALQEIDRARAVRELCERLDPVVETLYPDLGKHVLSDDPRLRESALTGVLAGPRDYPEVEPSIDLERLAPTPRRDVTRVLDAMMAFHPPNDADLLLAMIEAYSLSETDPPAAFLNMALSHESVEVVREALWSIPADAPEELGSKAKAFAGSPIPEVREAVVTFLLATGDTAALIAMAADPESDVALRAFESLPYDQRPPELVEAFLRSDSQYGRARAIEGLPLDAAGLTRLRSLVSETDGSELRRILQRLGDARNPDRLEDLVGFLADPDVETAGEAARVVAQIAGEAESERLLDCVRSHREIMPSSGVVEALRHKDPDTVYGWLERCLAGDSRQHRSRALIVLGGIPDRRAIEESETVELNGYAYEIGELLWVIAGQTDLGYVIDGDTIRLMPWERAIEEIAARR